MKDFTTGPVGRQIIWFSLPIILGNFVMQFYQIIDSAVVGRYLGKEALAAVGASGPVVFAIIALVIGIGSGASVIISQYFGAKDYDKARITSDTLHIFLLGSGIVTALIGVLFSRQIFDLMKLPEDLIPMASQYLRITLGGVIFLFGFNTVVAILRGVGDSKTPLYFLIISAFLNIILDLVFVLGFKWGIAGAAWATLISQATAYMLAIWYINHSDSFFHINFLKMKFNWKIFGQCITYGLPTGIQQSLVAFGSVALFGIVNGWGTDVIAGYTAGIRVDNLAVIPSMNFAMALTSFTGQNVGAGRMDRVRQGLNKTMLFSSGLCLVITAIIVFFGKYILRIFTKDMAVIDIGSDYLVIVSSFYLIFSAMFVINGMLRGAGAVIFPMISTLVSLWIVRIPVAVWLSKRIGETGIWWSIPIGWTVGLLIVLIYYWSRKWENQSIFAREKRKNRQL